MKFAIDMTETCNRHWTGCAHYAMHVAQALTALGHPEDRFRGYVRLSHWRQRRHGWRSRGERLSFFHDGLWPVWGDTDVVLGFGSRVPLFVHAARVATLFDVFAMIDRDGAWSSEGFRRRKREQYARLAREADLVITISESTRADFLRHFDVPPERVRTIHGGVDARFAPIAADAARAVCARYALPARYLLFVGALVPRKNVARLLRAFAESQAARSHAIVIAGAASALPADVAAAAAAAQRKGRVLFLGGVPDADLPALYAAASGFVFPTLYEGFGLPILEAMACGVPVLTGDRGAAPEVANGFGVMVDPTDVASIAAGIDRLAEVSGPDLARAGAYARSKTWGDCARATREACVWAVANRRGGREPGVRLTRARGHSILRKPVVPKAT